jgi:PAS domain-containing protein
VRSGFRPPTTPSSAPMASRKRLSIAADITAAKQQQLKADAENAGLVSMLEAIGGSQAMIEFEPDGTIVTANENFLAAMGYALSEINGMDVVGVPSAARSNAQDRGCNRR